MITIPRQLKSGWLTRRRLAWVAVVSIATITVVIALYLILLCHPGMFFRHAFAQSDFFLYSDEPIPLGPAERVLDEVALRLARTPLYHHSSGKNFRIYLCNQKWRFVLFANTRYHVGGLTYPPITNNIFLRTSHIDVDRLVGPSGQEVPGERKLSYYITHEIMHTLMASELGAARFWSLPTWKGEGYADYIGKGGRFDYDDVVEKLRNGARELNPRQSGLYLRYHLLIAYLLDRKGKSVSELLRDDFDPAQLEAEILADQHGS
jgi:hypothetical protein